MNNKRSRGRPVGTGKWGEETRPARVPASMTNDELAALIEFREIALEIAHAPSPYQAGSVRARSYWECQRRILDAMIGLGLGTEPRIRKHTGLPPYEPKEQTDECRKI